MEEGLRHGEDRFRHLADNARDVIYRMSLPDGRYEYISPSVYTMFGYSQEEFYNNPLLFKEMVHPRWHTYFEEQWVGLLKGEMPPTYEYQIIHKSGNVRWLNQRNILVKDENGNPLAIEGVVTDITPQKQTEELLRDNEDRYRMAQTISHTGSWEYNLQTTNFWGSEEARRIYGFNLQSDSFTTDEVENCIPERERVHQALVDLIEKNKPYNLEFEIHPKNSSESRIITSIAKLQRDEHGNPVRIVGVIQDITEKKKAEEKLNLLNFALNNVYEEAYLINVNGRFDYVNDECCRITGYSRQELLTMNVADVNIDLSIDRWTELWSDMIIQGSMVYKGHHKTSNGRIYPVEISANYFEYNGHGYILTLARNVSDRKRIEDTLFFVAQRGWQNNKENFFYVLAQFLGEILDMNYVFIDKIDENPEIAETVALYTEGSIAPNMRYSLKGTPCENVMGRQLCIYHYGIQKLFPEDTLLPGMGAESYAGIPLWDSTGHPVGLIAVIGKKPISNDASITQTLQLVATRAAAELERKYAEEKIQKLNQELEQRVTHRTAQLKAVNNELEAFAYSVSHDLRAPLRHIDGYIELLKERIVETIDEKSLDYLNKVSEAARRMGNLIDDLLAFSRMGRQEIVKREIDLNLLVQEVIQEFKPDFETRNIQWLINELPPVSGENSLLKAVLVNLLSNAIKFTRPVKQAKIEIGHYLNDNEVVVFVRDNGVGFDQMYTGKLFGVFQRLHLKDEFDGTGIGLANVRRIVERHGGKVWAEGKVDQGATFYFSLPPC